ncbi:MAG TPA: VWA domain-containing protein [Bryobacteraceae bacterium]|jgi:VWFA-related protein|nr:VWA domain-containing protein [Bryobacteraceae bacterium]
MRTRTFSRFFAGVPFGPKVFLHLLTPAILGVILCAPILCFSSGGGVTPSGDDPPKDTPAVTVPNDPVALPGQPKHNEPVANSRSVNIRAEKTLVLINVTVTDPLNRFVTGLEREHFRLFEDKIEQEISQFSSEDAPISIGLVFDTSGSMGPKLAKSRQAASEFFKTSNPADEFFLVQFNDRPELTVPFTSDTDKIQSTLTFTQSHGRTALLDSVYLAMHEMKKAHNPRKALLVISDGGDNSSRYTETEIKSAVREADVQIFAIGIYEGLSARSRTPEEAAGPSLLNELAEQTGGRAYAVENVAELPDIAAKIGIELRNEYILGYTPKNRERDGKYRRVQVKLVQPRGLPPLKAYFRLGYYAPSQ